MNKLFWTFFCTLVLVFPTACKSAEPHAQTTPRNVIFMLVDGMGFGQVKAYRFFADDPETGIIEPLAIDAHLVGAVSTDSIAVVCDEGLEPKCERDPYGFTDSASSATAYATGSDTVTGRLSMDFNGQSMTTILEKARKNGKSTGLVATSEITHASPAAFGSHVLKRDQFSDIANQFFDNQWNGKPMVNVMLGGGLDHFRREDRDLVSEFVQSGYQVALNRSEMLATQGEHLLGLFAPEGLPRAWDRDETVPTLAEMTSTALNSLSRNEKGFFLMVEGSQVDWASHGNSVAGVISEMQDTMAAAKVILDFAKKDGNTLVVVVADHETGGMAIGRDGNYSWNPQPLKGMKATPSAMIAAYIESEESLSDIVAAGVAYKLTVTEADTLDATEREEVAAWLAVTEIFNARTNTGWTSTGHTGVDVPMYAYGPGSKRFHGVMQNEDVGRVMREMFLPE
jgi:alkaline phosphatase